MSYKRHMETIALKTRPGQDFSLGPTLDTTCEVDCSPETEHLVFLVLPPVS